MSAKPVGIKMTILINLIIECWSFNITGLLCCISSQCYNALFVYEWNFI